MYRVYINGKLHKVSSEVPEYPVGTTKVKGLIIVVHMDVRCPKCQHFVPTNEMAAYGGHEDCEVASKTGYTSNKGTKANKRQRRGAHESKAI